MEIFKDIEQGTDAWRRLRCGIPTASMFKTVMASGKDGGESKTRDEYMRKLAGEILTGEPMDSFSNSHMERGKVMEDEARDFYSFLHDSEELHRVGFIRNGKKGCSPDSLLGTSGMLEIKTALPHILIEKLEKDAFPPEHKAQSQGNLWVAQREWITIVVYWPKMPPLIKKAYRDELYIQKMATAVDTFNADLAEMVERIQRYGSQAVAA